MNEAMEPRVSFEVGISVIELPCTGPNWHLVSLKRHDHTWDICCSATRTLSKVQDEESPNEVVSRSYNVTYYK